MHSPTPKAAWLLAPALAVACGLGLAQVERLDLAQMVSRTDGAVAGTIVGSEVIRVDHPVDGPELYFTSLLVRGTSLYTGLDETVAVTFAGGFVSPDEGVHNSEAPSADETRAGNRVVVFYKYEPNMGGDVSGNALYAAHGGLYRVVSTRRGDVVLGRGDGYAVSSNLTLADLRGRITTLR